MRNSIQPVSRHYSLFLFFGVALTLLLTLLISVYFSSPLQGISGTSVQYLNSGWTDEEGNAVGELPCSLDSSGDVLYLEHDLLNVELDTEGRGSDVFVFRTRYETMRVWADETLIYETAQGEEHSLGSRWHVISADSCKDASTLRVEFTRYDGKTRWNVSEVFLDNPNAVRFHLICSYLPAILFWFFSLLFTLLLIFITVFVLCEKIPGVSTILALAAFVFLSGQWILLDSKITTLFGGNYALTYFFSYCAFYLLMVPFLLYIQLLLDCRNRILRCLPWVFIGNAVICMGLHFFDLVPIQNTAFVVHILILFAILVSTREFFRSVVKWGERKVIFTFFGVLFIYAAGLISIILYYLGLLPPTNNAVLYSWALLILILSMTMDAVFSLGRFWKQRQYMDRYRQLAIKDSMTLLGNRNAYELHLQRIISNPPHRLVFILFDVDNLKMINDTYGHHVGDQAIYLSAQCIREIFEHSGSCYRIGGDEFCVILTSYGDIEPKLSQFDSHFDSCSRDIVSTTVSHGWAETFFVEGQEVVLEDILALKEEADQNLYRQKRERKRRAVQAGMVKNA